MNHAVPDLMFVTNHSRAAAGGRLLASDALAAFARQVDAAVDAGLTHLQIRERDLPARAMCAFAARAVARWGRRIRVIVNDRLDVAIAAGAAGVHLRADGPAASRIRSVVPAGFLIGRSAHTVDEARTHQDVDWLLFGPVFATPSHPGVSGQGLAALADACAVTRVPIFAIGGITADTIDACIEAGAAGAAGIRLFQAAV